MVTNPREMDIQYLKGIGPKKAVTLRKRGVRTVEDLLYYFPRRYEDRRQFSAISKLQVGQVYTIKAQVLAQGERRSFRNRRFTITEIAAGDATGRISCIWFNQPYLKQYLKVGMTLILYGKVELYGARLQMTAPEFEVVSEDDEALSVGRIVPVYTVPEGFSQRSLRALVNRVIESHLAAVVDELPHDIRSRNNLLDLAASLREIHFPLDESSRLRAYERLAFEEFLLFQLPLAMRKISKQKRPGIAHRVDGELVRTFIGSLPFSLTPDQRQVVSEIAADMARPQAMQRLLQGDVGSGKTVVATIAAMMAMQGGYQSAFMAPTEVLAKQHFDKIKKQISAGACKVNIGLLIGSMKEAEKQAVYRQMKSGDMDLVIGTHAVLDEEVKFKKLGLVVIDEQHKFGVGQRALLQEKGMYPDVLIMTATPIPRTLAITIYGDLDISVIRHVPPGRKPVETIHVTQQKKRQAYARALREIKLKHQVFIVYPVIEESYALDIAGANKMYEELRASEFRQHRVGLLHGKLKTAAQDEAMEQFKKGSLDVIVATTVLEVGIDVPNATCMIIEDAQRFGLSQLHQLRGRVGRGTADSVCILICDPVTDEAQARMRAMVESCDGFRIAEEDLKIRGPGEFFGARQHGLTELKIGNPLAQLQLLKKARDEAIRLVTGDQRLEKKEHLFLRDRLIERFPEYEKVMMIG